MVEMTMEIENIAHNNDYRVTSDIFTFNAPNEERWKYHGEGVRQCWFCGSWHPGDLLEEFKANRVTHWSGSDWKYGWPHKFYIDLETGKPYESFYEVGNRSVSKEEYDRLSAEGKERSFSTGRKYGTGSAYGKFYNVHLYDIFETDKSLFKELTDYLEKFFHIRFEITEDRQLKYWYPKTDSFYGYQTWGNK